MPKIRRQDLPNLSQGQLRTICRVLGDTDSGLTGFEIGEVLAQCRIKDVNPDMTKWKRLLNALATRVNKDGHTSAVLDFIKNALEPARYVGTGDTFEHRRSGVNMALAFAGLEYTQQGKFRRVKQASTLDEAERRALRLKENLEERGVHADVLRFCRAELVEDNYFHAVLEATKSVAEKIRARSGLAADGAQLVQDAFAGKTPMIRINNFASESEQSEQRGFTNLLIGLFGTFRNPTAHAARVEWDMSEEDALDLFSLASYAHRRIDAGTVHK